MTMAVPPTYGLPEAILVSVGDLHCSSSTLYTPRGRIPLREVQFTFQNNTFVDRVTPGWAIAMAVISFLLFLMFAVFFVGFFFLLGLLFLLAKEERVTGAVYVNAIGQGFNHGVMLPMQSGWQINDLMGRVAYANNLANDARWFH